MLVVKAVTKSYRQGKRRATTEVLKGVTFDCERQHSLAIIGESGSGKSTLARLILGIERPDSGQIVLDQQPIMKKKTRQGRMSVVFQNYLSSLHPYFTVKHILVEALRQTKVPRAQYMQYMTEYVKAVGLDVSYLSHYPHMLSGGEAQRVAIARAIIMQPEYIVLDEAISSLDMSIQTQVLDLLITLRERYQLSYIFITHDIQAATYICDDIIIFRAGGIHARYERATLATATDPYTVELLTKQLK